jgi:hypothetical protein
LLRIKRAETLESICLAGLKLFRKTIGGNGSRDPCITSQDIYRTYAASFFGYLGLQIMLVRRGRIFKQNIRLHQRLEVVWAICFKTGINVFIQ